MARLVEGVNDLATLRPDILPYWDYKENNKNGIYPNKVSAVSKKSASFICKKCGNPFDKKIRYLVQCTCKKCTSRKLVTGVNDLATTHPHLLKFWDYKENDKKGLDPTRLTIGSSRDAYWICEKCGKSYPQRISNQFKECNLCKVCVGKEVVTGVNDLATTHPIFLKEWDYEKNNEKGIYPTKISYGSHKRVHWKCGYGHSTYMEVYRKTTMETGCSECNKGRTTSYSEQYLFYCFSKIFKEVYNRYDLYGKETDIYIIIF